MSETMIKDPTETNRNCIQTHRIKKGHQITCIKIKRQPKGTPVAKIIYLKYIR